MKLGFITPVVGLVLSATVPLHAAVGIAQQPASQYVDPGTNVTFSVAVTNTGPVGYQWYFEGTNIAGANGPTLVVTNVQAAQSGFYKVLIRDCTSAVMSDVAILTLRGSSLVYFATGFGGLIYTSGGQLAGNSNRVQLNVGLNPQPGSMLPFGAATPINLGRFFGGNRTVPVAPGSIVFVQVKAWEGTWPTWQDCWNTFNCRSGWSPILRMRTWTSNVTDLIPIVGNAGLFDFAITPFTPPSYFSLTEWPPGRTAQEGLDVALGYGLIRYYGPLPYYSLTFRWFKDGLPISDGPTNQSYSINTVRPEDAGAYHAIAWHLYQNERFPDIKVTVTSTPTFAFQRVSHNPTNGVVEATLNGQIGCPCAIEYSPDLRQWFQLTNGIMSSDQFTVIDPNASLSPQRFYRARSDL